MGRLGRTQRLCVRGEVDRIGDHGVEGVSLQVAGEELSNADANDDGWVSVLKCCGPTKINSHLSWPLAHEAWSWHESDELGERSDGLRTMQFIPSQGFVCRDRRNMPGITYAQSHVP